MSEPCWHPATRVDVERFLRAAVSGLEQALGAEFKRISIAPRRIVLGGSAVEAVYAVAQLGRRVIYFEDIEEVWEVATLDAGGRIPHRSANQYELSHAVRLLVGEP